MSKVIFLDSMVFMHFRSIEGIDFLNLFNEDLVEIIIPRVTIQELDKHKNTHPSRKIRDRVARVLSKIEKWIVDDIPELRPEVTLKFYPDRPSIDFNRHGLDPQWNDDQLIASIIEYREKHPDATVVLVTQDTGPKLTAHQLKISVDRLPEELMLPSEPDPLERENRELKARIQKIESALPEVCLCFSGSQEITTYATFTLSSPLPPPDQEIEKMANELRGKYPKHRPDERSTSYNRSLQKMLSSSSFINAIPAEEYDRYNNEIDEFISEIEAYLQETGERRNETLRTICLELEVRNTGSKPADDVDLLLDFPDGFQKFMEEDLPQLPDEPQPPKEPRTNIQMMQESLAPMANIGLYRRTFDIPVLKPQSAFKLKKTNSYEVEEHFERIKHGDAIALPNLYVIFDSYESASSFNFDYVIRPANLPEGVTGKLHVVIKKASED